MQKHLFYQIFIDLNPKETQLFIQFFTKSNQSKDALKLLKFLYTNKDNQKTTDKKWVFSKIFTNQKYNDQKLRHIFFLLNEALENFIYSQSKHEALFEKKYYLLEYYRNRKLYKLYEKTYKNILELTTEESISSILYLRKYQLSQSYNKFLKAKQIRTVEPKLQEVSDSLDMFYISQKLFILLEALNYKRMINIDYHIDYIEELMPIIISNKKQNHPLINTTIHAINTINESNNDAHFELFMQHYTKYNSIFNVELIDDFLVIAKNYCIKKINSGESSYTKMLFNIYKEELIQDIKKHKYQITPATYKNIVSTAFSLDEYDWAFNFINSYTNYLPNNLQHSYSSYNKARYYFHYKKYNQVCELLMDVEYSDIFLMFNAKALEIKTYYELKEWNFLDSLLKSFNMLLRNKKSVAYHKEYYQNFIFFTNKLRSIQLEVNTTKKKNMFSKLKIADKTIDKTWVDEKMNEIKKSFKTI